MAKPRVKVLGSSSQNTIFERRYPCYGELERSERRAGSGRAPRLIVEPLAARLLLEELSWRQPPSQDQLQKAGLLIGNFYRDTTVEEDLIWGNVLMIVRADNSLVNASSGSIDIPQQEWRRMIEKASHYRTENLQVIGWYHTHLNRTPALFSAKDRSIHRAEFTFDHSFGVVLNPNQGRWSIVYGPEARSCSGEFIFDDELTDRFQKPQLVFPPPGRAVEVLDEHPVTHDRRERHIFQPLSNQTEQPSDLTLGKVVGDFIDGMGKLVSRTLQRGSVQESSSRGASPTNSTRRGQAARRTQPQVARIEVLNAPKSTPVWRCSFFVEQPGGSFIQQLGASCDFADADIETLLRKSNAGEVPEEPVAALIEQVGNRLEVSLLVEGRSNAAVVWSSERDIPDRGAFRASGVTENPVDFVIVVNEASEAEVRIRIFQLASGVENERTENQL